MKKFFSKLAMVAMSVAMLPMAASALTVNTHTIGNSGCAVIVQGQIGNGGVSCDNILELLPDINCSNPDADTPSVDEDITPPVQDNDTPSGDIEVIPPVQDNDTPSVESGMNAYEKEVIRLVNEIRVANGLGELVADEELSRVARIKSQDMRDNNYFSHTSPVYGSPFDMMKKFGISYKNAGENIARGQATPQAVVDGWMNSEGHRANILNASYNRIGVGYVAEGNYWTQMFVGR